MQAMNAEGNLCRNARITGVIKTVSPSGPIRIISIRWMCLESMSLLEDMFYLSRSESLFLLQVDSEGCNVNDRADV